MAVNQYSYDITEFMCVLPDGAIKDTELTRDSAKALNRMSWTSLMTVLDRITVLRVEDTAGKMIRHIAYLIRSFGEPHWSNLCGHPAIRHHKVALEKKSPTRAHLMAYREVHPDRVPVGTRRARRTHTLRRVYGQYDVSGQYADPLYYKQPPATTRNWGSGRPFYPEFNAYSYETRVRAVEDHEARVRAKAVNDYEARLAEVRAKAKRDYEARLVALEEARLDYIRGNTDIFPRQNMNVQHYTNAYYGATPKPAGVSIQKTTWYDAREDPEEYNDDSGEPPSESDDEEYLPSPHRGVHAASSDSEYDDELSGSFRYRETESPSEEENEPVYIKSSFAESDSDGDYEPINRRKRVAPESEWTEVDLNMSNSPPEQTYDQSHQDVWAASTR